MKTASLVLVLFAAITSGCATSKVSPGFDLESDFTITIFHEEGSLAMSEEDQATLRAVLRFWLPRMRTAFTTYPTAARRLSVIGRDKEGRRYEGIIFVGGNWIGDGHGVVTLADTEVFKLRMLIDGTEANQRPQQQRR